MPTTTRQDRWTPRLAGGVFLLAWIVYLLTMAPTLSFWDCGEFITTSHILGIPHQPGTPLYVLVGRCFDLLLAPVLGSTARAVNAMSGFFSALAVMFTYLVIVRLARRADPDAGWLPHAGGLVGALMLTFSHTFWNNAIEAEVYGLAAFMITFLTWLALKWYDVRRREASNRLLLLMIYLLGLGVGFHLGTLLVFPGIFVLVLLARERRIEVLDLLGLGAVLGLFMVSTMIKDDFVLVGAVVALAAWALVRAHGGKPLVLIGGGLFLLGLSVHIYLLIRAGLDPAINQSQPDNFATLMEVLRREQYPPMNPFQRKADFLWQIGYYYHYLVQQFTFLDPRLGGGARWLNFLVPVFLGLLGAVHALLRARPLAWLILVNYLINADILNVYLNFTDHEVRDRDYFFFAGFLYFAVFIGIGAAALLRYLAGPLLEKGRDAVARSGAAAVRIGPVVKVVAGALVLVAALPLLVPGHTKWFEHDRHLNWAPREYAWNMLAGLDHDAILFTNGDNDTFPVWYLQQVEGFRKDVSIVNLSLVNLAWYNKQLKRYPPTVKISYSDRELEELRPVIYEDPETGRREYLMVKDYVVHNILQNAGRRPVYFAVTIPQENMKRYYGMLRMEGLAYRFTGRASQDGNPTVDPERLLANAYGVYDYRAVLTGDSDRRRRRFAELNSLDPAPLLAGDPAQLAGEGRTWEFEGLYTDDGERRRDVFFDTTTSNLMGNYPAGMIRAGYAMLQQARTIPVEDDSLYQHVLGKAEAAFEMARSFDPTFPMVADIYPLLLIERHRPAAALAHLDAIHGRIPQLDEERTVGQVVETLYTAGADSLAEAWLQRRRAADPGDPLPYRMLFKLARYRADLQGCRAIAEAWRERFGQEDPAMERALAEMEREQGDGGSDPGTTGGNGQHER